MLSKKSHQEKRSCYTRGSYTETRSKLILPSAKSKEDIRLGADILDGRGSSPDLSPQNVVEDVNGVLLPLEVDPVQVGQDEQQKTGVVRFLEKMKKVFFESF